MALLREDRNLTVDPAAPERSHLALFRLIPLLRPVPPPDDRVDLRRFIDRPGHNPLETHVVSSIHYLALWLLLFALADRLFEPTLFLLPLLFLLFSLVATIVATAVILLTGLLLLVVKRGRLERNPRDLLFQSLAQQGLLLFLAVDAIRTSHWGRWIALGWLTLLGLEMAARLVMVALRREGSSSAPRS
jgi:hypothetical protein